jgi:small nuclear ribonucleoprotein E
MRIEGVVVGFDEYMNIVMDKAEEVRMEKGKEAGRKYIGRILLKGDNIALMQPVKDAESS